jgi:hypothetical protein
MVINFLRYIKLTCSNLLEYIFLYYCSKSRLSEIDKKKLILILKNLKNNNTWNIWSIAILNKILKFGFDNFLRFSEIKNTMFFNNEKQFNFYCKKINILSYKNILKENTRWNPKLSNKFNFTSINKVHQFYHLYLFNFLTKKKYAKNIIEIGGGYGLLASLSINFLDIKRHYIIDLPSFNFIQEKYLDAINCPKKKIKIISYNVKIKKINNYNLFAFWSISEIEDNKYIKIYSKLINNSEFFLIGYQSKFYNINNENLKERFSISDNFSIKKIKINNLSNNYYLFGKNLKRI